MKKKKLIIVISVAAVIVCGFLILRFARKNAGAYTFETAIVERGSISNTVTATGTLEAITTVEVGSQVSGVIEEIYVDFNSNVKKGQLLAKLDETPLLATLAQSKASVDDAEAELEFQRSNYNRLKPLYEKKLISQSDFDQATYSYNKAKASLNNAKAVYDRNKVNLEYATIYSPIDGVILNRAVDQGQTVAASFNTPTLFTIANDLTQMQVEADIDEADIGQVKEGQRVEFTVDAYPDSKFDGTVSEVRLQPVVTSNVVTYIVIINAPNPDKKLMPGMTASTTIFVNEQNNTLVVPGKAMRFTPDFQMMIAYFRSLPENERPKMPAGGSPEGMNPGEMNPGAMNPGGMNPGMFQGEDDRTILWIKDGNLIRPTPVETGINNGSMVEVKSGLEEGDEVVLSMNLSSRKESNNQRTARSPFMPGPPGEDRDRDSD